MMLRFSSLALLLGLIGFAGCSSEVADQSGPTRFEVEESADDHAPASGGGASTTPAGSQEATDSPAALGPPPATSDPVAIAAEPPVEQTPPSATAESDAGGQQPAADDSQLSAQQVVEKVQGLFREEKFDEALVLIESATAKENPEPILLQVAAQAFQFRGRLVTEAGQRDDAHPLILKSAQYARRLIKLIDSPPAKDFTAMAIYNEACVFALTGKPENVVTSLQEAIDLGFSDVELLKTDEDFESLRADETFVAFVEASVKQMAEKRHAEILEQFAAFESFDFNFGVTDLDDQQIALSDYQGQVVIVDFWGTWCPPCRAEIPHFIALQKKYKEQGLRIIGLNYNEQGTPEQVTATIRAFMESNEMNYPCAIGDEATITQVPNLEGFPTTLFIDRAGKVRMKLVGLQPLETLEGAVSLLLAEPPPEGTDAAPADEESKPDPGKEGSTEDNKDK